MKRKKNPGFSNCFDMEEAQRENKLWTVSHEAISYSFEHAHDISSALFKDPFT